MTEFATAADYNIDGLDQLAQVWAEAAQGDPNFRPILPVLKVPAGGSTTWEDKDDPSFQPRRELEVVILHSQVTTQLYLTDYEEQDETQGNRPDAWSDDGIVQVVPQETYAKIDALNAQNGWALPYPTTDLRTCPFNKFVGDPGAAVKPGQTGGKWNAEYHELYVVVRGSQEPVPYKVRVSPASIKQWAGSRGYKNRLLSRGVRLHTIETVLTLQPVKSGNVSYSEIIFNSGRRLDPALMQKMGELAEGIRSVSQGGMFSIGAAPLAQQIVAAAPVARVADPAAPVQAAPAPVQAAPVPAAAAALDEAYANAVAEEPVPAAPAADPGVAAVTEAFGAVPAAPSPAQAAPAPAQAAPAPVQATPVPVAAPAPAAAAPAPAPVAAQPAQAQPAPVAVGSGADATIVDDDDSIDF